ncbi:GH36-type glycosyl hydrolase domain-containing protein [uncultured Tessaracoccus sp.]|uniref:GH36-type glycosyl hydrolase domain-containing protein n=1 Tax=uncultured Tessaracoccus sp. TaxID=905023 RepID=UPI0025E76B79|nr:hypothetical protein [uncultured Tessaracoccus sp.]
MTDHAKIEATFTSSGALAELNADDVALIQYPATELEAGPQQVWLRRRDGGIRPVPLSGPASGATIRPTRDGVALHGSLDAIRWALAWQQPADGVFGWRLELLNVGDRAVEVDAVHLFDPALAPRASVERNEYYVSQYLDVTPVGEGRDVMLAVRQNMPHSGHPWLALSCTDGVAGWCTDASQLHTADPAAGLDLSQDLPSVRLQHEHTLLGLQTLPITLEPNREHVVSFRAVYVREHVDATSVHDMEIVRARCSEVSWVVPEPTGPGIDAVPTLFAPVNWAHGEDLDEQSLLGLQPDPRGLERGPRGELWAYWSESGHVVAAAKEREVRRPHGHVLQAATDIRPQACVSASTAWMSGTFASQLVHGHAHLDPVLSVRRSYLGLLLADGLRIFVRDESTWNLLGTPSAWAVAGDSATWWYRFGDRTVQISVSLTKGSLDVSADVDGGALDFLLFARRPGDDAAVFADARGRGIASTKEFLSARSFRHRLLISEEGAERSALRLPDLISDDEGVQRLARVLPWLAMDARIHYQSPRGLEQFTGGAWGTRDVCQGPVGLLVATDQRDVLRSVLLTIFAGQQDDGNWPQWFDYLENHAQPGHRESHGDVVYWPLLALSDYILATGDESILEEDVRWAGDTCFLPKTSVLEHVKAAMRYVQSQRSDDPRLPAFGHGDWNDSLQPSSPELASAMTSTWTAGLEVKALEAFGRALRHAVPELAAEAAELSERTKEAINELLLIDGELCGYAIVNNDTVEPLVHPRDARTGLRHGSLQMIHAIADELLTPDLARRHLQIITDELEGPAGVYLFDRPVTYHGGETRTFLRAEAASFWGREIGLMYTHAHIRWVEALLQLGEADRAWTALQKVLPEGARALVPGLEPLQSNCYYSSIDASFSDRYEAQARASELFSPSCPFAGGWRVYSSGPGLVLRLVVEGFLGLKMTVAGLHVDPVLPETLDGLRAQVPVGGRIMTVRYHVQGTELQEVLANGQPVVGERVPRRYRTGGMLIPRALWAEGVESLDVVLG